MNFNKNNYENKFPGLTCNTSEEILHAIEIVTGDYFSVGKNDEIEENAAYELWENGGREQEILKALPMTNGGTEYEDGDTVSFGDSVFAEFDGEKWILDTNF